MSSPSMLRAVLLTSAALLGVGCGSHGGSGASGAGLPDASVPPPAAAAADDKAALTAAARQALARDALRLTEHEGTWTATHFAQGHTTRIDATGATMQPVNGSAWKLGLHVTSIGRRGAMHAVAAVGTGVTERVGHVVIERGDGVREWFVHDGRGLEQGIDLASKPAGAGSLLVEVAVDGMTAVLAKDGNDVELSDEKRELRLRYGKLAVKGADGQEVPARLGVEGGKVVLRVEDSGAAWPLVVDPLVFGQQAELVAGDAAGNDYFGNSVAISGTTAIVGVYGKSVGGNSSQGAAYIFTRSGGTWSQLGSALHADDGAAYDDFGASVGISGTTAIVGAFAKKVGSNAYQGAAYVFAQSGGTWSQLGPALHANDGAANDEFGQSVAISGTTAIVGAFRKTVGANVYQGAAYVFAQSGSTWTQLGPALHSADGAVNDGFGSSVAISGTTAILGAPGKAVGPNANQGAAYIFAQIGSTWTQLGPALHSADGAAKDAFGSDVAISGTTAIVGAYLKAVGTNPNQGAAYIFAQSGGTWTQLGPTLLAGDGAANDEFGVGVALSGTTAIVGAPGKTVGPHPQQGAAYIFTQSGGTWGQLGPLKLPPFGGHPRRRENARGVIHGEDEGKAEATVIFA